MPGHHIPEPFCWDESFKVFYENLDQQHRILFSALFKLSQFPTEQDALTVMVAVMNAHFLTEEILMKRADYSERGPHKNAHDEFMSKIRGFHVPVSAADMNYCKDWLVNHIKDIDFKYKTKLTYQT
uniref:Hemerythrin n=1 Tax=Capilloventer sp. Capillo5 TaxID=2032693 RepID=A0A286RT76_9ANNE|nr:hemerythrin [Capilloventer sp. Capillo5]